MFKKAILDSILAPLNDITIKLATFIDNANAEAMGNSQKITQLEQRNSILREEVQQAKAVTDNINSLLFIKNV